MITPLFLRDPGGSPKSPCTEIAPSLSLASVASAVSERGRPMSVAQYCSSRYGREDNSPGHPALGLWSKVTAIGHGSNNSIYSCVVWGNSRGSEPRGVARCGQQGATSLASVFSSRKWGQLTPPSKRPCL